MAIGTTIKVALDSKAVAKGFAKIKAGFKRLSMAVKTAGRAMLAPFIKMMAVLAPLLGAAGFARGIKDIVDFGGEVSDLANRAGVTAKEIVILQEAMRRTGLEGVDVAKTLQTVGKRIHDGLEMPSSEAGRALKELGLTGEDFAGMNLAEQFEFVGSKITGIKDAGLQAKVAMGLFSREGFKLINLFKTAGVFDTAAKSVGGLGDNLNQTANKLDHISDAFGAFTLKMRQFFAGVVTSAMPALTALSDWINALDLSEAGAQFGSFLQTLKGAFSEGNFGKIVWESLKLAAVRFGEFLKSVLDFAVQQMIEALADAGVPGVKSAKESELVGTGKMVGGVFVPTGFKNVEPKGLKTFGEFAEANKGVFGSGDQLGKVQNQVNIANLGATEAWLKKMDWNEQQILQTLTDIKRKGQPSSAF